MMSIAKPSPVHDSHLDVFDKFFNIRILNPKVASSMFGMMCNDKNKVRLDALGSNHICVNQDLVTMAVIVEKLNPKSSSTGNQYLIVKLSGLNDCSISPLGLFLFGEAYKTHWKLPIGTVVALLNPGFMENKNNHHGLSLKIDNSRKLVELGQSKDFAFCKGKRKDNGKSCRNFVNRSISEFCDFHILSDGRKMASRRCELQSPFNCPPKNCLEQKILKNDLYFYGGKSYCKTNKSHKITLEDIAGNKAGIELKRADRILIEERKFQNADNKPKLNTNFAIDDAFVDVLRLPTAGALNLRKHLGNENEEQINSKLTESGASRKKKAITFRSFLESHRPNRINMDKQCISSTSNTSLDLKSVKQSTIPLEAALNLALPSTAATVKRNFPLPKLAQTMTSGNSSISVSSWKENRAKQKAVSILQKRKLNQNNRKGSMKFPTVQPQDRLAKDCSLSTSTGTFTDLLDSIAPEAKRIKAFGDIDLKSEKINQILTKPLNDSHVNEIELANQENYFSKMEAKEKIETRLNTVTVLKGCHVITCKICDYTSERQSDFCKQQNHVVTRSNADKRFFLCNACGSRMYCFTKYPLNPCTKCGSRNFHRTSIKPERKVLTGDDLKIRGDEIKFVNN